MVGDLWVVLAAPKDKHRHPVPRGDGLLSSAGAPRFPGFDLGKLPARALGRQFHRLGKGRITLDPPPRRRAVNAIADGKLNIGKVDLGHGFALQRVAISSHMQRNIVDRNSKAGPNSP